ncbi:MAG TPA: hypothetical protein VFJ57_15100 [Solirubrobacterales bacterium]|nr:hypothetical protein [Solirubrobacterales bacterium]
MNASPKRRVSRREAFPEISRSKGAVLRQIGKRLTYANAMSSLAVFLALGGATAFAASHLGRNSVGTKQLQKNAVTAAELKKRAVTSSKLALDSVTGQASNPAP